MPNKQQKTIKILALIAALVIALSINAFAAQDFIIENRTSALLVVNGTTGNIIMAPSFGLVGIGTVLPYNTLTVVGSVGISGSLNASSINTTGSAYFATNSGNVGIGKTSPNYKLDVAGTINASGLLLTNGSTLFINGSSIGIGTSSPSQLLTLNGGNFLQTVNGTPTQLAGADLGVNFVNSIYVVGDYAYLGLDAGTGTNEFLIVDVSNRSSATSITLKNVSGLDMGVAVNDIKVVGKYAYVGTGKSANAFVIVDISNVSAPKNVSSFEGVAGSGAVKEVYISGKYAYLASTGSRTLQIVDISNPSNPTLVAAGSISANMEGAWNTVFISGRYAYLGGQNSGTTSEPREEFRIFDISNPSNPVQVGSVNYDGANVNSIYVSGKYAYLAISNIGLQILDVSNPTNITNVSLVYSGVVGSYVTVAGRYAYLAGNPATGLSIIDISSPSSPVTVGGFSIGTTGGSVFVSGKTAYLGNAGGPILNDFVVLDINGIDAPAATIGSLDTSYLSVSDSARIENNLYVGTGLTVGSNGILSQGPLSAATIGINVSAPVQTLQVLGTLNITSASGRSGDLFVSSSGNVGIGTTSPQNKLEVIGSTTLAGGVNASSLNVTGFSITDDSLVTVVEFENASSYEMVRPDLIGVIVMPKSIENDGIPFNLKHKDKTANMDSLVLAKASPEILEMLNRSAIKTGNLIDLGLEDSEQNRISLLKLRKSLFNSRSVNLHNFSHNSLNSSMLIAFLLPDFSSLDVFSTDSTNSLKTDSLTSRLSSSAISDISRIFFFNCSSSISFNVSENACLATEDQLIQSVLDIFSFNSSGTDNVIVPILDLQNNYLYYVQTKDIFKHFENKYSSEMIIHHKTKKIPIKDIKAGDYALSLDESTGKLVPRKVNALLDHGIKPIYEMTTEDGRAINTTGEHPYFAILKDKELCDKYLGNGFNSQYTKDDYLEGYGCFRWVEAKNLNNADDIIVPLKSDSNNDYLAVFNTLLSPTIVNPTNLCDFSKYLATIPEPKSTLKAGCGLPNEMYNTSAPLSYSQDTCSGFSTINFSILSSSLSNRLNNKQSKQSHLRLMALYKLQQDIYSLLQESCETSLLQEENQNRLSGQSQANLSSLKSHSLYSSTLDGLSQYAPSSHLSALSELQQPKTQSSFKDNMLHTYINLFVGNSDIFFDRIAGIKAVGEQHVYDLSIEGTRNFIANDIVAHNTYLATGSGNVGIGTTTPATTLHVNGTFRQTSVSNSTTAFEVRSKEGSTVLNVDTTNAFVGIGTTGPVQKLQIESAVGNPATSGAIQNGIVRLSNPNDNAVLDIGIRSGGTGAWIQSTDEVSLATNYQLLLNPNGGNVGIGTTDPGTARLAVVGGYVGINDTSPDAMLEVAGRFMVSNASADDGNLFIVNSAGDVGIRTTVPALRLNVIGTGGLPATSGSTQTGIMRLDGTTNSILDFGSDDANPFGGWIQAADETNLAITYPILLNPRGGSVGINATNPSETLDLIGTLRIRSGQSGNAQGLFQNAAGNVGIGTTAPQNKLEIIGAVTVAGTLNASSLNVTGSAYFATNSGNVGIGTTAPGEKLHVIGNANISGSVFASNFTIVGQNGSLYQPVYGTDDDLILYLPFSEGSNSSKVYDRSPYGNDGICSGVDGGCNWTAGKYGNGLQFDGANDYIVSTLNGTELNQTTISFWVNPNGTSSSQVGLFQWASDLSSPTPFALIARKANTLDIRLYVDADYRIETPIPNNAWSHVSVTLNRDNLWSLYVNGELRGTYQDASETSTNQETAKGVYFANGFDGYFAGFIDEPMIYKRALAPEEIRTHYLRGNGFGASGAITADKFRVVNTSASRTLELNTTALSVYDNAGASSLYVDRINSRVGIGTISPQNKLEIIGAVTVAGTLNASSLNVTGNSYFATSSGNVGINTTSPNYVLQVQGGANISNAIYTQNNGNVGIGSPNATQKLTMDSGTFLQKQNANPILVASMDVRTNDGQNGAAVFVSGKYAYVGIEKIFYVIDVSNMSSTTQITLRNISVTNLGTNIKNIQVVGKHAFIGLASGTFLSMDISNASSPKNISRVSFGDGIKDISISGKHAYLAGSTGDLGIVDISNPANMTVVGSIDVPAIHGTGVDVQGKYAYLTTNQLPNAFYIIDVSNPTSPAIVGNVTLNDNLNDVEVSGHYAYVAGAGANAPLSIIDVSNPTAPTIVTNVSGINTQVHKVYPAGNRVYATTAGALVTIDTTNISNPRIASNYGYFSGGYGEINSIFVSGKYAYLVDQDDRGLEDFAILDIGGIDIPAAFIGTTETASLRVLDNAQIDNTLNVRTGIEAGYNGLLSHGPIAAPTISINASNPSQTLQILGTLNITSALGRSGDLFVSSSGNVGIGTTAPQNKLEVIGSTTLAGGVNASSLNVTGFSITDDSLVTVVEFDENKNKEKTEFHNQILQTEPAALTELNDKKSYRYIKLSVLSDDLSKAGVAQSGTAADSDSAALTGLRVRNFGFESKSEVPSSSAQNDYSGFRLKKIPIKDIKAGQYALSLDESTGKLVPRKVSALLDHGIKPIYELATEDGRAINTTAEHPYLVKLYDKELCDNFAGNVWNKEPDGFNNYCTRWVEVAKLKIGSKIAVPKSGGDYFKNISTNSGVEYILTSPCFLKSSSLDQIAQPKCNANAKYGASLACGANFSAFDCIAGGNLNIGNISTLLLRISNSSTTSDSESPQILAIVSIFLSNSSIKYGKATSFNSSLKNSSLVLALPIIAANRTVASTTSSIYPSRSLLATDSEILSVNSLASLSEILTLDEISLSLLNFSALSAIALTATPDQSNLNSFIVFSNSSGTEIVIVFIINKIDYSIYKAYGLENSGIIFEEITSIKSLPPQHVYDLSIEGTRNFIANDIVAHNTYLATSSGKVGINTTNPGQTLTVAGTLNISVPNGVINNSLFISSTGRVGIGRADGLGGLLEVMRNDTSSGGSSPTVVVRNPNAATGFSYAYFSAIAGGIVEGRLLSEGFGGGFIPNQNVSLVGTATNHIFGFITNNLVRGVIDTSGNFGIGTTAPGRLLEVAGSINGTQLNISGAANLAYGSGSVGIGTHQPYNTLTVVGSVGISGSLNASSINTTGSAYFATNSGNVGIGTTSPNYKLDVAGTINASGLLLTNGSTLFVNGSRVGIGTSTPAQLLTLNGGNFLQTVNGTLANLGGIDMGATVFSVYVAGKYAYLGLGAGGGNEFTIVDVSNRTSQTSITINNVSGIDMGVGVNSVQVAGKYAYLALSAGGGNKFQIVDISNVSSPKNVSGLPLGSDNLNSVFVSGKYAYVIGNANSVPSGNNFGIIDISNPLSPILVSSIALGTHNYGLYVAGKYAYVGTSNGFLQIVDISNPSNPVSVGTIPLGIAVRPVYVIGKYAYVGVQVSSGNDFFIVDVSNPTNPQNVSGLNTGTALVNFGLYVSGKYAYIFPNAATLRIADISNPSNPVFVSSISISNTGQSSFVSGKYLYFGTQAVSPGNEFNVLDINGIDSPAATIGALDTSYLSVSDNARIENNLYVGTGLSVGSNGILSQGPLSVVGNTNSSSSFALRISNWNTTSGAPLLSLRDDGLLNLSGGLFSVSNNVLSIAGANGVDLSLNNSIYINSTSGNIGIGTTGPLQKLHINGNNFLQTINGTPTTLGGIDLGVAVNSIYVAGKYAYLGLGVGAGTNEFTIVDISNRTSETSVTVNNISGIDMGKIVNQVIVAGKYAYLGLGSGGGNEFQIVDISNVSAPKNVSGIDFGSGAGFDANAIFISGKYAYAVATDSFLRIIDISNPTNPLVVGSITTGGGNSVNSVYVVGKYAYVTKPAIGAINELQIYDISNPSSPILVGGVDFGANINGIDVEGRYAYVGVASGRNELVIVDISDPTNPKNVSKASLGADVQSVKIAGRYAYLGLTNDFAVVDISNPSLPTIVSRANLDITVNTRGVFVSGKQAYIGLASTSGNDFRIFDISGIDAPAATIGSLDTSSLSVQDNARIENNLYVGTGAVVGVGGILSQGPVSIQNISSSASVPSLSVIGSVKIMSGSSLNSTPILNITNSSGQTNCVFANNGDFYCTGTKSAFVSTQEFSQRKLYAVESPDVRHIDEGRAKLKNGFANVSIDPIFMETVEMDYNVYLTPEGKTKALYIDEKAEDYFIVRDTASTNAVFSYIISAYRRGYSSRRFESGSEIEINAVIDEENKMTDVEISGLNDTAIISDASNESFNESSNQSVSLITGNAINEFGLEEDLSGILDPEANTTAEAEANATAAENSSLQTLAVIAESNASSQINTSSANESAAQSNTLPQASGQPSIQEEDNPENEKTRQETRIDGNRMVIYSVDEDEIIREITDRTKLDKEKIKSSIKFRKKEPVKEEYEFEEPGQITTKVIREIQQLPYMTKVNGSVIIRIG